METLDWWTEKYSNTVLARTDPIEDFHWDNLVKYSDAYKKATHFNKKRFKTKVYWTVTHADRVPGWAINRVVWTMKNCMGYNFNKGLDDRVKFLEREEVCSNPSYTQPSWDDTLQILLDVGLHPAHTEKDIERNWFWQTFEL